LKRKNHYIKSNTQQKAALKRCFILAEVTDNTQRKGTMKFIITTYDHHNTRSYN